MCGIAGHIGLNRPSPKRIADTIQRLWHRGPDSSGSWSHVISPQLSCTLVFTRLAIQDLSPAADQPFHAGPVSLVFNGEIYNFRELRMSRAVSSVPLETEGDTEILARLIALRGEAALSDLEGMFAIAWFNSETTRLTLARDAFGEKPLLIHRDSANFWFASDIAALAGISGIRFKPNEAHLRRFLVNGYRSLYKVPETFFEGVGEIGPGRVLSVSATGSIESSASFWSPRDGKEADPPTYAEAVQGVRERLVESMRLRLRSDVPIALSLSGGVDSTALLAIATKVLNTPLETFTIQSGDSNYDDSAIAKTTAEGYGVPNTPIDVRDFDFDNELKSQVLQRGAPVLTISSYAQHLLMSRVSDAGYKVIVEGTGADEIFAGYYDHHNFYLSQLANSGGEFFPDAVAEWERGAGRFVRNPFLKDPDYLVDDPTNRDHLYLDADFFRSLLVLPFDEPFQEVFFSSRLLRNRMLNEISEETLPVLLAEADANAMGASVENRSPFLDRQLFEFAFGLPDHYLIRNGFGKAILRDAVLPWAPTGVIYDQEKRGFNFSMEQVIDLRDNARQQELLRASPIWDLVNRDRLADLIAPGSPLPNSRSKFLFSFLSVRAFLEWALA